MDSTRLVALFLVIVVSIQTTEAVILESYIVDPAKVSVSGLSAGGYMAGQMHISHSKIFAGVGILAAGPFWCAQASLMTATTECMISPYLINVGYLQQITRNTVFTGFADPLNFLEDDRVYLYSGTKDYTVVPGVVQAAEEYYLDFVPSQNIKTVYDVPCAHGFPTVVYGTECGTENRQSYINKCDYDAAYDLLEHIHGPGLQKPKYYYIRNDLPKASSPFNECADVCDQCQDIPQNVTSGSGTVLKFDQTEFFGNGLNQDIGLEEEGFLFVPDACADGSAVCGLHVVFHGCRQGEEYVGDTFVKEAGYNEVAALNNFIIVYPQVKKDLISNPNGCFDWWGYTDSSYASNIGKQVVAVRKMVERIANF